MIFKFLNTRLKCLHRHPSPIILMGASILAFRKIVELPGNHIFEYSNWNYAWDYGN